MGTEKSCLCRDASRARRSRGQARDTNRGSPRSPCPIPAAPGQQPSGGTQHAVPPPAHAVTPLGSAGHRCRRGSPDPPGRSRCPSCCCLPLCSSRRLCRLIKQILHLLRGSRARQGSSGGGLSSPSFAPRLMPQMCNASPSKPILPGGALANKNNPSRFGRAGQPVVNATQRRSTLRSRCSPAALVLGDRWGRGQERCGGEERTGARGMLIAMATAAGMHGAGHPKTGR